VVELLMIDATVNPAALDNRAAQFGHKEVIKLLMRVTRVSQTPNDDHAPNQDTRDSGSNSS
jgi:hypothetical protein